MHGHAQRRVRRHLDELVASGRETGVQVAAYRDGELAVHAWAGLADPATGDAVGADTLFPVFSVSKGILATLAHILVDRGELSYGTRIAELWPEFGAHGKEAVTLAHVLEHSAGVPYFPWGLSPDELLDTGRVGALPADNPFQRAVGGTAPASIVPRRTPPSGRSWGVEAALPFAMTMTAHAGARIYGALARGGEIDGVRLLSRETLAAATRIRRRDTDEIVGVPVLKSLGYGHGDEVSGGREAAFGFGGLGGAEAYADPAHGLSFVFAHNRLTPPSEEDSAPAVAAGLRAALEM